MIPPRRPGRRIASKGRSLRFDPPPQPAADRAAQAEDLGSAATGSPVVRPGSRAANRAAKRAASGVRPKTQMRGSGGRRRRSNTGLIALAIGALVIVGAVILIGNPFGTPLPTPGPSTARVVGDGTCPTAQPATLPAGATRTVTISTPKGNIVLKIDGAPVPDRGG